MPIAGQSSIENARTTFEVLSESALLKAKDTGIYKAFTATRNGGSGVNYTWIQPGATPTWRRWQGEKVRGGSRKLSINCPIDKYHKSIELDRTDVVYDMDGSTAALLQSHLSDVEYVYDKLVIEKLNTNPTCIDGSALLSDTHPYGASGATWDNLGAATFTWDTVVAARKTMRLTQNEYGEYLGIEPKILLVDPSLWETAQEICSAEFRGISVGTGSPGITIRGSGLGATAIPNVAQGGMTPMMSPRLDAGTWLLIDPRFPCMGIVEWGAIRTVVADDLTDPERRNRDQFQYDLEADLNTVGLEPYGIYGYFG